MQIANPIYDVVFKYLMDDNAVAKLMISEIIGRDVISLDYLPREHTLELETPGLTVYRLDFSARIRTEEGGTQLVLIEVQKAKFAMDIVRFRRYLGDQYADKKNMLEVNGKVTGIPIVSIYFLGHELDRVHVPFLHVERSYRDGITGEVFHEREAFVESLSHDSYIVQIPHLRRNFRGDLEILLSVFDQNNRGSDDHILNVKEEDFPPKYRPLITHLQRAISNEKVRKTMDVEDEILGELQSMERRIQERDEVIAEKEGVIAEKEGVIAEKEGVIAEKEGVIAEKEEILAAQAKALEEQRQLIEALQKKLNPS